MLEHVASPIDFSIGCTRKSSIFGHGNEANVVLELHVQIAIRLTWAAMLSVHQTINTPCGLSHDENLLADVQGVTFAVSLFEKDAFHVAPPF